MAKVAREITAQSTPEITKQITPAEGDEFLERYERFLSREPLNDELAAVQRGEIRFVDTMPGEMGKAPAAPVVEIRGAIKREDRVALREMKQGDGWPVLMRLCKKRLESLRERAISISQDDPLANGDAITREWAYVLAYQKAFNEMQLLLEAELKTLWEEEQ